MEYGVIPADIWGGALASGEASEYRPVVPEPIQGIRSGKRREEDTEGELYFRHLLKGHPDHLRDSSWFRMEDL